MWLKVESFGTTVCGSSLCYYFGSNWILYWFVLRIEYAGDEDNWYWSCLISDCMSFDIP